jgi:biopolymer transport protein ExbB
MAKSKSNRDDREEEEREDEAPNRADNSAVIALIVFLLCAPIPTVLLLIVKSSRDNPPKDPIPKFLLNDWFFAGPMLTMALVAIALVVWRSLLNYNAKTDLSAFLPEFQETLQKDGVEGALHLCKTETGLIPRKLYVAALETSKQGISAQKRAMASVLELEILPELNFLLAPILAIAKIATMVGLLGTVISMVDTFSSISNAEGGDPTKVTSQAGAIGLALFATALGLMTAIPLVFAHVLFKDWITRFETKMKAAAQRLIILFQTIKPRQGEAKKPLRRTAGRDNEPQRQRSDSRTT